MLIKIGNEIVDPKKVPVMLVMNDEDVNLLKNMSNDNYRLAYFQDSHFANIQETEDWMRTCPPASENEYKRDVDLTDKNLYIRRILENEKTCTCDENGGCTNCPDTRNPKRLLHGYFAAYKVSETEVHFGWSLINPYYNEKMDKNYGRWLAVKRAKDLTFEKAPLRFVEEFKTFKQNMMDYFKIAPAIVE